MTAKGYWIANNDIRDWVGIAHYRGANKAVMDRYGANFIIMGGDRMVVEGPEEAIRGNFTVVEFPSREAAIACYYDPEYVAAAKLRHAVAEGSQVIVEGYDGPQDFDEASFLRSLGVAAQ